MFFNKAKRASETKISGQATLPTVLLIGGIVIVIATVGAVIAVVLSNTVSNARLSAVALAAAQAGAQYGVNRVRAGCVLSNGALVNTCCPSPSGCNLTVGSQASANIIITPNGSTDLVTIDSVGSAGAVRKKVEAVMGINLTTGLTSIQSVMEIKY
ncbi:MAG TPA: hypothetical protein VMU70_00700 [Candidatus Tyrphobacter sp.]|nr:hypothetical protein [Candidatus Tyrphobacter sp.]